MKYMVMECHLSYAVVLDEEGRFLKVANRHYEVGQTVTNVIEMQVPQSAAPKKKANRWIYSVAATAACLMLVVTLVLQMGQMTYASVYMTINPEVRIDVNRNDVVVGLDGVNTDGDDLINGYRYKKKDLDLVMDELVDRAIDMGYLHEGGQISLVLDADSDEWVISHSNTLTTHLNEHLNEKLSVTIEVTDKNTQNNQVIIPVAPGESDYGESDYGETEPTTQPPVSTEPTDSSYGDSNYDDGQTDYGNQDNVVVDGQSDYDDSEAGENSYSDSSYDNGQTDYSSQNDAEADGQPDYASSDSSDDGQSNYGSGEDGDNGTSNYSGVEVTDNGSQSDYHSSDDGQSDYDSDNDD